MRNTGIAGSPGSHFHAPSLERWLSYYGLKAGEFPNCADALNAIFKAASERGKGAGDIFGLRLQRHSFDFFAQQLSFLFPSLSNDRARIEAVFGKTLFIHLTRENKLDQAISYVKAKQSGLWHMAPDGTELERLSEPREPVYDAEAIATRLRLSVKMDGEWEAWFAKEKIEPLRVTYSELSLYPYATLERILETLCIHHEPNEENVIPVAKLADATNQVWAERFKSETLSIKSSIQETRYDNSKNSSSSTDSMR